ncbi:MAG: protein-L-isoaspartate(D-aspartate) O-methyltransferase [Rhodobacteraceae bacterium]|nr:protein-L-isoaspartate(D-aspartate) O-methyltransferase [Paracoccaceae bacterium]
MQGAQEDSFWPQDGSTFNEAEARAHFVLSLRKRGVSNTALLSALERVPRRLFLPAIYHIYAYEDVMLPIECGQAVLAPSYIARVIQMLDTSQGDSVLEIGTGSGYQTAILSHLAARVVSVERYSTLASLAKQRIDALKLENVTIQEADGLGGCRQHAPFDRIVLTGAVKEVPDTLVSQLSPSGLLIAPIGPEGEVQVLTKVQMEGDVETRQSFGEVRMVSLRSGRAEFM